jgi:flagellar protein FliO/FliZ
MDFLAILRTLGALGVVLGLLVGALWLVRRYNIRLPGGMTMGSAAERRLSVVERLPIDGRRSVALIRRDDKEHLVLIAPEGLLLLEVAPAASTRPPAPRKAGFPPA